MLSIEKIHARVAFAPPVRPGTNRKTLAQSLHEEVCRLAEDQQQTIDTETASELETDQEGLETTLSAAVR